ncbi:chaperonin 10-like protein [Chaetomium strumarium]|uniref:Chaperonin 10-like protein n=1 Tax=Chaetomium strumarium TaxID=1170767 RepID=A0AAJ0GML0_9PEZI|nr:chaperonin 10-like protein [Chaetomium strumarium]
MRTLTRLGHQLKAKSTSRPKVPTLIKTPPTTAGMSTSTAGTNLAALLRGARETLVLEERAIPSPGPDEILVRNRAIALNPIDWKRQAFGIALPSNKTTILGSDVAGEVVSVGSNVASFSSSSLSFAPGDRVLGSASAMVSGNLDHGAFQLYTLLSSTAAAKIPDAVSYPEAATLPTAMGTATIALFHNLGLPLPSTSTSTSTPTPTTTTGEAEVKKDGILVWGGATSCGSAAIQLARLAGLSNIYATASPRHHALVQSLGASTVVDYHSPGTAVEDILSAAGRDGVEIRYAVVNVGDNDAFAAVKHILERSSQGKEGKKMKVASLARWPEEQVAKPEGAEVSWVMGMEVWGARKDLAAWLFNRNLTGWLEGGQVVPHAVRVVKGGIGGLQTALDQLKAGVSGEKLVVEV